MTQHEKTLKEVEPLKKMNTAPMDLRTKTEKELEEMVLDRDTKEIPIDKRSDKYRARVAERIAYHSAKLEYWQRESRKLNQK